MPARVESRPVSPRYRSPLTWLAVASLSILIGLGFALLISLFDAGPILRGRVIQTLSERFQSRVDLRGFHITMRHGIQVSGDDLRIYGEHDPNKDQPGVQPLFSVANFSFSTSIWNLLRSPMHIHAAYVQGLTINIPPKNDRQQMARMQRRSGQAKLYVEHFFCNHAGLVINTSTPGKLPLVFDIQNLVMDDTGPGQPLRFHADLVNPKPVGMIHSSGRFGPFREDSPRDTAVQGSYSFRDADLSTIQGIGGMLSSFGSYSGTLDHIVVDGSTSTPNFEVTRSGHAVPLATEFHAIVDGTTGDTYLDPVRAKLRQTTLVARGSVVKEAQPAGHRVKLQVTIDAGHIDDLLILGVRTDPPVMTGNVTLNATFDLPPGEHDLSDRLFLDGGFDIVGGHFSNDKIQDKVGALSLRSQGKPKMAKSDLSEGVLSQVGGKFRLRDGMLTFSQLRFSVPGTRVEMTGRYSLDGNEFDFHGKARMQAKLSHMMTGWKSLLLKAADPFFQKHGAGTELPVKITGTKSEPKFGLDFRHHNEKD